MADDEFSRFVVEYAKSNRSKCQACKENIEKGSLRIGPMVQSQFFDGLIPLWHHDTCFEDRWLPKHGEKLRSTANIGGLGDLKFSDQQAIRALVQEGTMDEAAAEDGTKEERLLAEESKKLWAMRELAAGLSNREMKDVLEHNDQPHAGKIFGGESKCLDRIADGMLFGALPKCDECDGDLRFVRSKYVCTGSVDAFTRCSNFKGEDVARRPWKIPGHIAGDHPALKKYKYKKPAQPRLCVTIDVENPNAPPVEEDEAADDEPQRKSGRQAVLKKKAKTDDEDETDEKEDESKAKKKPVAKRGPAKKKRGAGGDESSSSESEEEEEKPQPKKKPAAKRGPAKKKRDAGSDDGGGSSSSSSSESEEEESPPKKKPAGKKAAAKKASPKKPAAKKAKAPASSSSSSSDVATGDEHADTTSGESSEDEKPQPAAKKSNAPKKRKADEESASDADEAAAPAPKPKPPTAKKSKLSPFAGLTFTAGTPDIYGRLKQAITGNGGTLTQATAAAKKTDYFITNAEGYKTNRKAKPLTKAIFDDTMVVDEKWVDAVIEAGSPEALTPAQIEDCYYDNPPAETERQKRKRLADAAALKYERGKVEKLTTETFSETPIEKQRQTKQRLKVVGGVAVDPDSGLVDEGRVFAPSKKEVYSVTLNRVDLTLNKNSYYILQLIEHDAGKKWSLFRKWGKVGTTIGDKRLEHFPLLSAAKREFSKCFLDRTGNAWDSYLAGKFKKVPGLMIVLETDYSEAPAAKPGAAAALAEKEYDGTLDEPTQKLMDLIFDIKAMQSSLLEMEIDVEKMPLGKLSKGTLKKGLEVLSSIQQHLESIGDVDDLSEAEQRKTKAKLVGLSNAFYTHVPHTTENGSPPPVINTVEKVEQKNVLVQNLMDMEIATTLLEGAEDGEHPIDAHYKKLKCDFNTVKKSHKDFKLINKYLQNTHAATHNMYDLELESLWEIDREGEAEKFSEYADDDNRMLLWHGSRVTNWGGILSQGLRIAPPEAPTTGYMFGKGVYFADMSSKSANYCFTTSKKTTGVMVLCEVALGDAITRTKADYITELPEGYSSCLGMGKYEPNPKQSVTMDNGCVVPCGKQVENTNKKAKNTNLQYNEFIVYDVKQIRMRYLLQLDFKYKGDYGTFH